MTEPTAVNFCNTKKTRGRPRLDQESLYIPFRLRRGRSTAEDALIERLQQLPPRQRSRFIRRVLTTGEVDPVLEREFARESRWAASALDSLGSSWDDDEED
jgi:hypothetical protein